MRPLRRVFGPHTWADPEDLELYRWAADRWAAPMADVVRHALPARTVAIERRAADLGWFPGGDATRPPVAAHPGAPGWDAYVRGGPDLVTSAYDGAGSFVWRPLADDDVGARLAELAAVTLAGGRDVLVVVPDPASRVADAFLAALPDDGALPHGLDGPVIDLRTAASPRTQYRAWIAARMGLARVVVGVRGAAFTPLHQPGLMIVLDEANPALKERRSPRHHARELVLERARRAGAVGLLVGTMPSAATWRLLLAGRLTPVSADRRTERKQAPTVVLDTDDGLARTRLGRRAIPALKQALAEDRYGVVLASRGGEGRALVCTSCRHLLRCPSCGGSISRSSTTRWGCLACGWDAAVSACPSCAKTSFVPLAAGVEQLGTELQRALPGAVVAVMQGHDQPVPPPPAVLVLTRGSVMDASPGDVGAIILPDLEAMARRPSFDAGEDTLRLAMQLVRWAAPTNATVIARVDHAADPVVQALVRWDPAGYWRDVAEERAEMGLPPATTLVAVDVAGDQEPMRTLQGLVPMSARLGPIPQERGRRLLVKTDDLAATTTMLRTSREDWSKRGLDVRVDVEPT